MIYRAKAMAQWVSAETGLSSIWLMLWTALVAYMITRLVVDLRGCIKAFGGCCQRQKETERTRAVGVQVDAPERAKLPSEVLITGTGQCYHICLLSNCEVQSL